MRLRPSMSTLLALIQIIELTLPLQECKWRLRAYNVWKSSQVNSFLTAAPTLVCMRKAVCVEKRERDWVTRKSFNLIGILLFLFCYFPFRCIWKEECMRVMSPDLLHSSGIKIIKGFYIKKHFQALIWNQCKKLQVFMTIILFSQIFHIDEPPCQKVSMKLTQPKIKLSIPYGGENKPQFTVLVTKHPTTTYNYRL